MFILSTMYKKINKNTVLIPLKLDEEIENVGNGSGVLCKFKKLDLILLDLGQRRTLALYQPLKLILPPDHHTFYQQYM